MYECEEYGDYFEPSEADILFDDFKNRCRGILLTDVKKEIDELTLANSSLQASNSDLHNKNRKLKSEISKVSDKLGDSTVIEFVLQNLNKDNVVEFCKLFLKRDYPENEQGSDTPVWIRLMAEYYSNKEIIIDMLKLSNTNIPNNIANFRLPVDWSESELDIFFNTLCHHYNCNGNTYSWNLGHWQHQSLKSVEEQCNKSYSEIPWQFVLRNPILKEEKYLKLIGEKMTSSNGQYFCKIKSYQDISDKGIKIILDNIDCTGIKSFKNGLGVFLLENIRLIDDDILLDKIYGQIENTFRPFEYVKQMDKKYIKKYLIEHKDEALKLLEKCDNLDIKDKQEIIFAVLGC